VTGQITDWLRAWAAGDARARERLFERVYPELRALAARQLSGGERRWLDTAEVLHETYLRLERQRLVDWACRAQFLALAATCMRRVVVDEARRLHRVKRGGRAVHVSLTDAHGLAGAQPDPLDALELDALLDELEATDARASRLVELRCFGGLTLDEAAQALEIGRTTAVRLWRFARAFVAERRPALDAGRDLPRD
jgi:RNA polymerase sigma factor (TIGR02999 family)